MLLHRRPVKWFSVPVRCSIKAFNTHEQGFKSLTTNFPFKIDISVMFCRFKYRMKVGLATKNEAKNIHRHTAFIDVLPSVLAFPYQDALSKLLFTTKFSFKVQVGLMSSRFKYSYQKHTYSLPIRTNYYQVIKPFGPILYQSSRPNFRSVLTFI